MPDPNLHPVIQAALAGHVPFAEHETVAVKLALSDRVALDAIVAETGETENMAIQSAIQWRANVERGMTGEEMYAARARLGQLWGFGRPLHASELGRALRLSGRDPGQSVRDYERGVTKVSGPVSVCVQMWLNGCLPPDGVPR